MFHASYRQECWTDSHPAHPPEQSWGFAEHGLNVTAEPADT